METVMLAMMLAQMVNIDQSNWKAWIAVFVIATLSSNFRAYLHYKERREMRAEGYAVPAPPEDNGYASLSVEQNKVTTRS
jgi:hypothetical protein